MGAVMGLIEAKQGVLPGSTDTPDFASPVYWLAHPQHHPRRVEEALPRFRQSLTEAGQCKDKRRCSRPTDGTEVPLALQATGSSSSRPSHRPRGETAHSVVTLCTDRHCPHTWTWEDIRFEDCQHSAPADLFFLHGTMEGEGNKASIGRYEREDWTGFNTHHQMKMVTAFTRVCRAFAPLYRQSAPFNGGDWDLAYKDVLAAFERYLAENPEPRPLVLAGHSQGAMHLLRLIRERIATDEAVLARVAAVFAPGCAVTAEEEAQLVLPLERTPEGRKGSRTSLGSRLGVRADSSGSGLLHLDAIQENDEDYKTWVTALDGIVARNEMEEEAKRAAQGELASASTLSSGPEPAAAEEGAAEEEASEEDKDEEEEGERDEEEDTSCGGDDSWKTSVTAASDAGATEANRAAQCKLASASTLSSGDDSWKTSVTAASDAGAMEASSSANSAPEMKVTPAASTGTAVLLDAAPYVALWGAATPHAELKHTLIGHLAKGQPLAACADPGAWGGKGHLGCLLRNEKNECVWYCGIVDRSEVRDGLARIWPYQGSKSLFKQLNFGGHDYHAYDVLFFWGNIRRRVRDKVEAYLQMRTRASRLEQGGDRGGGQPQ